jgi:F-type H+-transporting ATPase subunit b
MRAADLLAMSSPFFLSALAASAPQAPDQQLLDVDGTVFVMLGLFFLVLIALTRLLWKPYLRVKEERVSRVEGYREEATRLESEASARLGRIESQLVEARRAASAERGRVQSEAQLAEQKILAEAQAAAQKILSEARAKLDAAFAAEHAKLQLRAASLGREITEKVLGRPVAS